MDVLNILNHLSFSFVISIAKDFVRLINKNSTNLIKRIGKSKNDDKPYDA